MNPLQISKKGGTTSDDEDDCIPERSTASRSSRSHRSTPKTPKSMAGRQNLKSGSNSYNSDNDIEPGLDVKNIKVPSLQDTPGRVLEYIKEITSMNKALIMKVKSLNGYVHVQNAKEDDGLDKGIHLRKTVKELTEELENYKRSRRFNGNSLKSGQKFDKTAAINKKVTKENRKVTKETYDRGTIKAIKSKPANTQLTQKREQKNGNNQKARRIETTTVTQNPHETKKPKAVNIPQKTSITVNRKSKEPAATANAESQNITTKKTLNTKPLKKSVGSQNTSKISKSTNSLKQEKDDNKISLLDISNVSKLTNRSKQDHVDKKISLADINKTSDSNKISSRYSACSPEDITARTRTSSNTIHTEFSSPQMSKESFSVSIEEELSISESISSRLSSSAREDGTVRTQTSSSSIHTEFSSLRSLDRSKESLSTSIEEELSIYSCSSPELGKLMIQKGQKADKATAVHSTSTPDVPHSINKISSLNSNHTVIKNVKRQGLELPSLIVYPKINPGSSATPPKIKSSSSVFESPQKRFQVAKKVGAAPLPSLPGLFNLKPPASPRPDTKNIRLPSLSSQTKFYNRQD